MTNKLAKSFDSVRAVARNLNATADEANKIIKATEKVLVEETRVGVSAKSSCVHQYRRRDIDVDGNPVEAEVQEHLAFGRLNGDYCIYIEEATFHKDEQGLSTEAFDTEGTAWSACVREMRLRAFEKLPELLENIIAEANRQAESGNRTAAKIKELIGDDDKVDPAASSEATTGKAKDLRSPAGLDDVAVGFARLAEASKLREENIAAGFTRLTKTMPSLQGYRGHAPLAMINIGAIADASKLFNTAKILNRAKLFDAAKLNLIGDVRPMGAGLIDAAKLFDASKLIGKL